jgi:hypothetical protein
LLADVRCDDDSNILNVTIDPGETVTCTFVNTRGYVRPLAASPISSSLVVAYRQCTSPNREHGPPLSRPSCNPHAQASSYLTVGTFDANGVSPNFAGRLRLGAKLGNASTPEDEADVRLSATLADVRNRVGLGDYAGELRASVLVQMTDRHNSNSIDLTAPGTVAETDLGFTVPCTPTAGAAGSDCNIVTTMNSVTPGAVKEIKRTIWAVRGVRVFDGGGDGDAETVNDNTVFATQGLFVP